MKNRRMTECQWHAMLLLNENRTLAVRCLAAKSTLAALWRRGWICVGPLDGALGLTGQGEKALLRERIARRLITTRAVTTRKRALTEFSGCDFPVATATGTICVSRAGCDQTGSTVNVLERKGHEL